MVEKIACYAFDNQLAVPVSDWPCFIRQVLGFFQTPSQRRAQGFDSGNFATLFEKEAEVEVSELKVVETDRGRGRCNDPIGRTGIFQGEEKVGEVGIFDVAETEAQLSLYQQDQDIDFGVVKGFMVIGSHYRFPLFSLFKLRKNHAEGDWRGSVKVLFVF